MTLHRDQPGSFRSQDILHIGVQAHRAIPRALVSLYRARGEACTPVELTKALTGRFREHHVFLAQLYLD